MATMISTENVLTRIILDGGFESVLIATKNHSNSKLPLELIESLSKIVGDNCLKGGRLVVPAKKYRELFKGIHGAIDKYERSIVKAKEKEDLRESVRNAFTLGFALKALGYLLMAVGVGVLIFFAIATIQYIIITIIAIFAFIGLADSGDDDLIFAYALSKTL